MWSAGSAESGDRRAIRDPSMAGEKQSDLMKGLVERRFVLH
jgi:hypothetical protein